MQLGLITLSGLIIAYFIWTIAAFAYNVPNADDFELIIFLLQYLNTEAFSGKTALLFSKHNEHYITLSRLLSLGSLHLLGEINFSLLIACGTIALLISILLVAFNTHATLYLALFILSCLLLQPQHAQAALWATSSLAMMFSTLFSILSFALVLRPHRLNLTLALMCAFAAMFTQANGLFASLICATLLLVNKRGFASLLFFLAFSLSYFVLYADSTSMFQHTNIANIALYFFRFMGSALAFGNANVALLIGFIILSYFLVSSLTFRRSSFDITWAILLFCILTAAANALSRAHYNIDFGFNISRYRFISALSIAMILLDLVKYKYLQQIVLCVAALFFVVSQAYYQYYSRAIGEILKDSSYRWQISQAGLLYPGREHAIELIKQAQAMNLYNLPVLDFTKSLSAPIKLALPPPSRVINRAFDHVLQNDEYLLIDGWAVVPGRKTIDQEVMLIFRSELAHYSFSTEARYRPDVGTHFKNDMYDASGFIAIIPKTLIEKGTYIRGILIESEGKTSFRYFGPEIVIE